MLKEISETALSYKAAGLGISPPITCNGSVGIRPLAERFANLKHEELHAYFVEPSPRPVVNGVHFRGAFDHVNFDPRLIFSQALLFGAVEIILAHNHPSGEPRPSEQDIAVTRQIYAGARLIGLRLQEHLIIAGDRSFSFRAEGLL